MPESPTDVCLRYVMPPTGQTTFFARPNEVADAITAVFRINTKAGALALEVPSCQPAPCADGSFRAFAAALIRSLPGIPFYVLGGGSNFSRELILALLPNLRAAVDAAGNIVVHFPALETQKILHEQFNAMLAHDISEDAAIEEMTLLSRLIGMGEEAWA